MATGVVRSALPEDEGYVSEQTLLLAGDSLGETSTPKTKQDATHAGPNSLTRVIVYFMTIHFLLAFCEMILVAPLIHLFENSLCLSHYGFPAGGIDQSACKIPEVQQPLATIRGWKSMFDTIPVLLVAIPMGKLGDRHGRRKIMALALLGVAGSLSEIFIVCLFPRTFSLRLVWLSSMILLCGGGLNSASAFMWAMASESIPADKRSHAFYYIFSAFYVAELVASFIASVTLDISPWIPCSLAMTSVIVCLLLLAFMPAPSKSAQQSIKSAAISSTPGTTEGERLSATTNPTHNSVNGFRSAISNRNVIFTIPVFLVGVFRYTTLNVLIQYASVRFGVKISAGARFYTETAIVNIVLFLFLIPRLTAYIRDKNKVSPEVIDLFLVRASVSLMCLGALLIGLAQSSSLLPIGVFVFSAGFGSRVSALSLVSYWISDTSKASLYATIVVFECLGHAVGDPSMLQIYAASLKLPPFWQALPFFSAAGAYLIATISASLIRVEQRTKTPSSVGDHQD